MAESKHWFAPLSFVSKPLTTTLNKNMENKTKLLSYAIFMFAALVIIIDFALPGKIFNDQVIRLQKERQQYFKAARNYHYSYKVFTSQHKFLVTEDFTESELTNKKIQYSVSRIFKKVNWYKLLSSENKSFYSLRIASGLILPILVIISILIAIKYKKKIGNLILILQILLIADLILLLT